MSALTRKKRAHLKLVTSMDTLMHRTHPLFRYTIYPLLVFGALGVNLALIPHVQESQLFAVNAAIGFTMIAIIALLERVAPSRDSWLRADSSQREDLLRTLVVLPVVVRAVQEALKVGLFALALKLPVSSLQSLWPRQWPLLAQLAVALLICEFGFYWIHRLSHTWGPLWRFHRLHHDVNRVYWGNSGRFGVVDSTLQFVVYLTPLLLLGVPAPVVALFMTMNSATGILEHANIDFQAGILNRVLNSAQLHRWHHAYELKYANNNYGKVLSVWDTVFNSYYLPKGREVGRVGVED